MEFSLVFYVEESRLPLWSSGQEFLATERRCIVFPVRYELNLYMLYRSLVIRVPGYRTRGLGSIHGSATFSEK
jgi:hypothetical protein